MRFVPPSTRSTRIPPDLLSGDDTSIILLKKLETVNRVDHHVHEFLKMASAQRPHEVIAVLRVRVERGDALHEIQFEPMPYLGLHQRLSGLRNSDEYESILGQVRDRVAFRDRRGRF